MCGDSKASPLASQSGGTASPLASQSGGTAYTYEQDRRYMIHCTACGYDDYLKIASKKSFEEYSSKKSRG